MKQVSLFALPDIPLIKAGDDLAAIILEALRRSRISLEDGDALVVAQKVVSKAEGRVVRLKEVVPSPPAQELAALTGKDPRVVQLILDESHEVLRTREDLVIVEQRLGFVCANAGVDRSNVPSDEGEAVTLLPLDPDATAQALRRRLKEATGKDVAVIISDTHGRAFREGCVGVAIGVAGLRAVVDKRGLRDLFGYKMRVTTVALADEIASAASLLMGHTDEALPVVLLRGVPYEPAEGSAKELIRPKEKDLFR